MIPPHIEKPHSAFVAARHGLAAVILAALIFFASWWNRYVPPTSGGEAVVMASWAQDYLPYRDYFMQAPPGIVMLVQGIVALAGPHLLGTLTFGVLLRTAGACALYGLLLGIARPSYAAIATATALFVSSTDISDTPFYYNHIGTALILTGTYLSFAGGKSTRLRHCVATVAGGALLTYAVTVKQTMIFGDVAAFIALVVLLLPRPRIGWIGWLAALLAGAALTVGSVWVWLVRHDLVSSFFFVIRRAPEGKGGVWRSLLRPLSLLFNVPQAAHASAAAWMVIAIGAVIWTMHRRGKRLRRGEAPLVVLFIITMWASIFANSWDTRVTTLFLTAIGWWGSLGLAALHFPSLRWGNLDPVGRAHVALGVLSFGIGYCFAVSWPLFEDIAFPGLAVVFAAMLERPRSAFPKRWVAALLVLAVCSMGLAGYRKFTFPHSWGFWIEPPIYETRGGFQHPALAGMRISKMSSDLYAMTSQIAHERTRPDDRIYVYPNMPILYAIADRRPATYSLAHWVDICPDFVGHEDAARLKANPPKLLIIRHDPIAIIAISERLYRGGLRSSVRDVVNVLDDISPLYETVAVFRSRVAPPILFLVRRDTTS